jgi:hypothetical protein
MNFGYLLVVAEHDSIDYLQLAYGLALSIKNTQREGYDRVAIVIDDKTKIQKPYSCASIIVMSIIVITQCVRSV